MPVNAAPATGVLDGQEVGVLELVLGVQPPPPPVETLPPHPQIAAKEAEIKSERRMRGSFTVVFPNPCKSGIAG
ncbi:MAG: hypothetical protein ABR865_11770 [Terracidiphilus sp.]|jgi:hypothetical protein